MRHPIASLIVCFIVLCFTAHRARADLATWGLQGYVTSIDPALAGAEVNVGDILTGSVTYEPNVPPLIDAGYLRGYFCITQMVINCGSFATSGTGGSNAQIDLWGNAGEPPGVVTLQGDLPGTINGHGAIQFKIQLDTATAPGMTPTLTEQPPILGNYGSRVFNIFAEGAYAITGTLTMIPEPGSVALLLATLIPLRRGRGSR